MHEPNGVSGAAVAAIVLAAVACAVLITLLVMNNQQQQRDADADRERAEQQAQNTPQPPQPTQQPPIVVVPGSQPAAPAPAPAQAPSADKTVLSNAALEASVATKLLDDRMLGTYPLDVKAENGLVTLNGDLPTQLLKQRAETMAKSVTGVTGVVNNIRVKAQ